MLLCQAHAYSGLFESCVYVIVPYLVCLGLCLRPTALTFVPVSCLSPSLPQQSHQASETRRETLAKAVIVMGTQTRDIPACLSLSAARYVKCHAHPAGPAAGVTRVNAGLPRGSVPNGEKALPWLPGVLSVRGGLHGRAAARLHVHVARSLPRQQLQQEHVPCRKITNY